MADDEQREIAERLYVTIEPSMVQESNLQQIGRAQPRQA